MPFQPGQKANPTGIQGKHRSLFTNALNRALLRAGNKPEALQDEIEAAFEAEEYTVAQELIDTLIDLARNGDLQAIKLLIERHEGKDGARQVGVGPADKRSPYTFLGPDCNGPFHCVTHANHR